MKPELTIDKTKCRGCGICTGECSHHLPIEQRGSTGGNGLECIQCFHCYAVCPQQAISVEGIDGGTLFKPSELNGISPQQLLPLLANRRSVRTFQQRPVEKEAVEKLLDSAVYIPSGGNSHAYTFTLLEQGEVRQNLMAELKKIYSGYRRLLKSTLLRSLLGPFTDSKTRAFLKDTFYLRQISYLLERFNAGEDPVFYDAPAAIFIHSKRQIPTPFEDSVLAAYNIVLTAETMGLGSCLVSLARNAVNSSRRCREILGLDKSDSVHVAAVLGYPAVTFLRPVPRQSKWKEVIRLV